MSKRSASLSMPHELAVKSPPQTPDWNQRQSEQAAANMEDSLDMNFQSLGIAPLYAPPTQHDSKRNVPAMVSSPASFLPTNWSKTASFPAIMATSSEPELEVHATEPSPSKTDCELQRFGHLQNQWDGACCLKELFHHPSETTYVELQQWCQQDELDCETPEVTANKPPTLSGMEVIAADNHDAQDKESRPIEETLAEITHSLDENLRRTLNADSYLISSSFEGDRSRLQDIYGSDDDTVNFDFEGTDSEIAVAIQEIRKEASRIDVAVALDQLHSLQNEFNAVSGTLNHRTSEVNELKTLLEERDRERAQIALERELYQADAIKLREDLETCVNYIFDITGRPEGIISIAGDGNNHPLSNVADRELPGNNDIVTHSKEKAPFHAQNLSNASNSRHTAHIFSQPSDPDAGFEMVSRLQSPNAYPIQNEAYASTKAAVDETAMASKPKKQKGWPSPSLQLKSRRPKRKQLSGSESFYVAINGDGCASTSPQSPPAITRSLPSESPFQNDGEKELVPKGKRCGFSWRQLTNLPRRRRQMLAMQQQVDQMHMVMQSSVSTSEKLRSQLSFATQHYEGIIRTLEWKLAAARSEDSEYEETPELDYLAIH